MSEHTKARHIKIKAGKKVLCVSEQGAVYKVPNSVLKQYVVYTEISKTKIKNLLGQTRSLTPKEAFADINEKYTRTGALLRAVRLREGLNQKDFAAILDVTQGDLSKMERGKRPIGKILSARIRKQFGSLITEE